jgi:hypothetical protein
MADTDRVADRYLSSTPERQAVGRQYLRDHLMFQMSPRAIAGLERYLSEAAALGLIDAAPALRFFAESAVVPSAGAPAPTDGTSLVGEGE